MIKLIATDIDGTLLQKDYTCPTGLMECLRKLEEKNVKVVLVTGRMHQAAIKIHKLLKLKNPLVSYQGGQIDTPNGEIIYQKTLDKECIQKAIQWARRNKVHLQLYTNDKLYAEEDNDFIKRYAKEQNVIYKIVNFDELNPQYASKMLAIDFNNPERVTGWVNELKEKFPECFIVKSTPHFCEISHVNANKCDAVKFLQQYYGLRDEEVLTIGDQNNDIALLQAGGVRVAMGNATPELKEIATYITDTVDNGGWIKAVEKFVNL